ncbi:GyrI-like domain-containing protein [Kineosporia sp. J2-2]|uniref:GyrI-like domain-containing protein n=1 Tax=Kineosporia corallincola TaxID=2835133 RepID=A0ABS5TQ89_9ACTN|nr:GyrI-like domain-containing protein [Kineosporia corallincola]MBT0773247.1 GyrI-like domain-containing protein [Kineosporia corallincola]
MDKYDPKRAFKHLYLPSKREFSLVDVPQMRFLAVDGEGDPNTARAYTEAVEALFSVSYTVKFQSRNELGQDYVVGPLEGLWRADDVTAFTRRVKDAWQWTMLVSQPGWINQAMIDEARTKAQARKELPAAGRLRLIDLTEGPSAQILHVGSYEDEAPVLARLHGEFMPGRALTFNGDHHEIYLSDPRRTPPQKWRTVLRQPVRPVGPA